MSGLSMSGREYASFIRAVMDTVSVRPLFGRHPRLSILGPLEVRLQHADLMILGEFERRRVAAGDRSGAVAQPADAARTRRQSAGAARRFVGA